MKWLFAPAFFICLSCAGQSVRKFTITLRPDDATEKPVLPFTAVKVLDARFDQSNVGCIALDARFHSITQYKELAVFPDSLKHYLPELLGQILSAILCGDNESNLSIVRIYHFQR